MDVDYIDHMGTDLRVADAARVSFDKSADNYSDEQNHRLIKYLGVHDHFTPFTHCFVTVRETVPIFVARQRFKHTVGFSYNEVSRRYVDDAPEFFVPQSWRSRAPNKKQGSGDDLPWEKQEKLNRDLLAHHANCMAVYYSMLDDDVAPELARMVLPQSMYTSYYCSGSLAAWARACNLRTKDNAQKEIEILATKWSEIIAPLFPVSWSVLTTQT